MSIFNRAALEVLCAASYMHSYLDCIESLPNSIQQYLSEIRELDLQYNQILSDIEQNESEYNSTKDVIARKTLLHAISQKMVKCLHIGDEKLQLMSLVSDCIENAQKELAEAAESLGTDNGRSLELALSFENDQRRSVYTSVPEKETLKDTKKICSSSVETASVRRRETPNNNSAKSKPESNGHAKREASERKPKSVDAVSEKSKSSNLDKPATSKVDTGSTRKRKREPKTGGEPTWCLCEQISYGEMVGCDNANCRVEWFHFGCVNLTSKPRGKWYCPNCRGDRANVMKR